LDHSTEALAASNCIGMPSHSKLLSCVLEQQQSKTKANNAEDRRIHWTKYQNIGMWFNNWEHDLIELGMGMSDLISRKVMFPKEQLPTSIWNFDKTTSNTRHAQRQVTQCDSTMMSLSMHHKLLKPLGIMLRRCGLSPLE
jgi:hypothetical protein